MTAQPIHSVTHPTWCDPAWCDPGQHSSAPEVLDVIDARFALSWVGDGEGPPETQLIVQASAVDGTPVVQVYLSEADEWALIALLARRRASGDQR